MTTAHIIHSDKVERAERLDQSWREQAACREYGPAIFYPVSSAGKPAPDFDTPLAVCRRCSVIEPCLEWATTAGEVKDGYTTLGHVIAGCAPRSRGAVGRPPGVAAVPTPVGDKARCKHCRALFTVRRPGQLYCTKACSQAFRTEVKRLRRRAS